MTIRELIEACTNGINVLTDLDGRGLITAEYAKAGISELQAHLDAARASAIADIPAELLELVSTDPEGAILAIKESRKA